MKCFIFVVAFFVFCLMPDVSIAQTRDHLVRDHGVSAAQVDAMTPAEQEALHNQIHGSGSSISQRMGFSQQRSRPLASTCRKLGCRLFRRGR